MIGKQPGEEESAHLDIHRELVSQILSVEVGHGNFPSSQSLSRKASIFRLDAALIENTGFGSYALFLVLISHGRSSALLRKFHVYEDQKALACRSHPLPTVCGPRVAGTVCSLGNLLGIRCFLRLCATPVLPPLLTVRSAPPSLAAEGGTAHQPPRVARSPQKVVPSSHPLGIRSGTHLKRHLLHQQAPLG